MWESITLTKGRPMNKIIFLLKLQMQGEEVADLQEGLRILLKDGVFQLNDVERQTFRDRLHVESTQNIYGQVTGELVRLFQEQYQLEPNGEVDEPTANAFNVEIDTLKPGPELDEPPVPLVVGWQVTGIT